jgi:hypothetical protein
LLPLAPRARAVPASERQPETRASGRIIWTGRLERRGVLEIDGRRATVGYLSGGLPQTPADIAVLPGELTATGRVREIGMWQLTHAEAGTNAQGDQFFTDGAALLLEAR